MLGLAALGWDFYKWRYSERVRLRVTASPNFVSTADRFSRDMIFVSITNIGKVSTKILNISLQGWNKEPTRKVRHGDKISVVQDILYAVLPVMLHPGENWAGGIRQDTPDIAEFMKFPHFIVSIEDSVSEWPWRAEIDKSQLELNP